MRTVLLIHIGAGAVGLVTGYLALWTTKGGPLHRRAGMAFVYAMLTMSIFGAVLAARLGEWAEVNIPAAVISAYLVITSLMTVRPAFRGSRWLALGALIVAFATAAMCLTFGLEAVANGGARNGVPAFPFFLFGVTGLLASAGDVRVMRSGALRGTPRLRRHLWRMSFALFIAALSFFLGQSDEIPAAIRILPLLAMPVLAVLVTMLYWLWRVRVRRFGRPVVAVATAEAA